jgi:hypothetical protein
VSRNRWFSVFAWFGALLCAMLLGGGTPARADDASRNALMGRIRAAQISQNVLPDGAVLADSMIEFLARRAFRALAAEDDRWNGDNPQWQRDFPEFRVGFTDAVKRVVAEYELRAAMDSERALNKVLAALSEAQLAQLDAAMGDAQVMAALASMQQAAPLAISMMGANALRQAYSAAEVDAMNRQSPKIFGPAESKGEAGELERPALKAYRERMLSALTDTTELFTRLDSPVLRSDLDALSARWRQRLGGR